MELDEAIKALDNNDTYTAIVHLKIADKQLSAIENITTTTPTRWIYGSSSRIIAYNEIVKAVISYGDVGTPVRNDFGYAPDYTWSKMLRPKSRVTSQDDEYLCMLYIMFYSATRSSC